MKDREKISYPSDITELLKLCIDIQDKGLATVFFEFSGHVNAITVMFYVPVWKSGKDPDFRFTLYTSVTRYNRGQAASLISQINRVLIDKAFPKAIKVDAF
jgi:hypothetical protein